MKAMLQHGFACLLLITASSLIAEGENPNSLTITPLPASAEQHPKRSGSDGGVIELPSQDSREHFSYHMSNDYADVAVVIPADGSSPLHVSKNFLGIVLGDPNTNDANRLQQLKGYENLTQNAQMQFMNDTFPGRDAATKSYQTSALRAGENDVILEQDPKAGPYVRVTVTDKSGVIVKQFSIARSLADEIMNHPHFTIEQKLELMGQTDNHLPEEAREKFSSLTPEEFAALIGQKPEVAKQEFAKMAGILAEIRSRKAARRSIASVSHSSPRYLKSGSTTDRSRSGLHAKVSPVREKSEIQKLMAEKSKSGYLISSRSWNGLLLQLGAVCLIVGLVIAALGCTMRKTA